MTEILDHWDALVVGAGVAGGCIAALLADRGWSVLLVEKSTWPRETVCGGCLSAAAVQTLRQIGMQPAVEGARKTRGVVWQRLDKSFEHEIPAGVAVLRCKLDAAIVDQAIGRGAKFLPGCCATLLQATPRATFRRVHLQTRDRSTEIRAKIVIACDGVNGSLLKTEPWASWTIAPRALMGVAATFQEHYANCSPDHIHMCIGQHGYVGRVRVDDATEHLAAALRPSSCRQCGGPLQLISEILQSCRVKLPSGLATARLHGTGKVTRHRKRLGGYRVLTLGDACGYVEPITGEGMTWAVAGAAELNQLIPQSINHWPVNLPGQWQQRHWRVIGRQQRYCRALKSIAHHPALAGSGIFMGNLMPGLAKWVARSICEPPRTGVFE